MPIASQRWRRTAESLLDELDLVLELWGARIDRQAPLTGHAAESVDLLLREVRRLVSRMPGAGQLRPLTGRAPAMPADAVLRLLMARHLLGRCVLAHARLAPDGQLDWHEPDTGDPPAD